MAKFSGVSITADKVAMAVKLTESATFAFASDDIKLDIFPPGQDATSIIPIAMVGVIKFPKRMSRINVTKGMAKNCEKNPIIVDFGFRAIFLKCSGFISRATPNIIKASVIFKTKRPSLEKFK